MSKQKFDTPLGEKETVKLKKQDLRTIARRSGQPLEDLRKMLRFRKERGDTDMRVRYTVKAD